MKKFMKRCGITALILILAGGMIATVAGMLQGTDKISGQVYEATNGKVNIRWDAKNWGITLGDGRLSSNVPTLTGKVEKKNLGREVSALRIDVEGCEFDVRDSGDDDFYVEAEVTGEFQAYVENGKLQISFRTGQQYQNNKIDLYVPAEHSLSDIDIYLGAGELQLGNVTGKHVQMELGAGEIEADALTCDSCTVSVGMGEVDLHDLSVDELQVSVGAGECAISGAIRRRATLDCSMGEIDLRLEGSEQDYNYQVNAAMGNVVIGNSEHSGFALEQSIDNHADTDIEVDCSMGDVKILFADPTQ